MILPGLAFTTSSSDAAFTFNTTSLLDILVIGSPNHSGPFATFLKAYNGQTHHLQVLSSVNVLKASVYDEARLALHLPRLCWLRSVMFQIQDNLGLTYAAA